MVWIRRRACVGTPTPFSPPWLYWRSALWVSKSGMRFRAYYWPAPSWAFCPNPFRAAPCKAEYEEGRFVGQAGDNTELQGDRSKVSGAPQSGVGHRIPSRCPLGSPPDSCRRVLLGGFLRRDLD